MRMRKYGHISIYCLIFIALSFSVKAQNVDYQLYEVQRSEGWYRVSKKFDVSQEELKAANPQCGETLRLGDTLRIPVKKLLEATPKVEPIDTATFILHTLQPKETLYGLSRRYGVSIEDIVRLNGENASRMAIGTQLRIPQLVTKRPEVVAIPDTVSFVRPIIPLPTQTAILPPIIPLDSTYQLTPSELPIRVAFLLPFMLDATGQETVRNRFVEFYEGALLAVNEAKNQGVNIEVHTFDVERNNLKVQLLLQQPQMKLMDAIIGPAYPTQVEYISNFAFDNKINTFVPFTSEVPALQINPYLYQFNPPTDYEAECMANVLMKERPGAKFILVKNGGSSFSLGQRLADELEAHHVEVQQLTIPIDEADTLRAFLKEEVTNVLIFTDSRYAYVKPYLQKIDDWHGLSTEVVGGCTWQTHEAAIGVPYYYTSLFSPVAGTMRKEAYQNAYDYYFAHSLSSHYPRYDMLGYDITAMVIRALNQYGVGALSQNIVNDIYRGIQSDIHFVRANPMGGCVNMQLSVMRYDNGATHNMQVFTAPLSSSDAQ